MKVPSFVQIAADPTLIAGIYDTCDQWCMYCPATHHCLAYRCDAEIGSGRKNIFFSLADRIREGMTFLKQVSLTEGRATPEIDALLADDPREHARLVILDDPMERIGRRYGRLSDAYLRSRPDFPFEMTPRTSGPTPLEVFAWYHWLVPGKVYRALVSASEGARGDRTRQEDALISAKVALIGMDRSLDALAAMQTEDDDARLDVLQGQLRRLRREVEARFPSARAVIRQGLDVERDNQAPNERPSLQSASGPRREVRCDPGPDDGSDS